MSGNGKVAPVPTSEPAVGFADADCVLPAKAASATSASTTRLAARMRFMVLVPLSLRFVGRACPLAPWRSLKGASDVRGESPPRQRGRVVREGEVLVTIWWLNARRP